MATQAIVPSAERAQLTKVQVNSAVIGTLNLVVGVANMKVRVYRIFLNVFAAQFLTFKDTTPANLMAQISLAANNGLVLDFDGEPWLETATGTGLDLALANAAQVSGTIWYTQRAA